MQKHFLSIDRASRFLLILQLCFGLSLALYFLGYPFMGQIYKSKSDLLLIESVLGQNSTLKAIDPEKAVQFEPKLTVHRSLFESLPPAKQLEIKALHTKTQHSLQKPLSEKLELFPRLPKLELLWAFLAIVLPILLLLKNAKALPFVWLFPIIALGYAWNNQTHGHDPKTVFPQFLEQDVEKAWKHYLIKEWGKETPNAENLETQAIRGEFFFNLARIQDLSEDLSASFWEKRSLFVLALYVIWNTYFAFAMQKTAKPLARL